MLQLALTIIIYLVIVIPVGIYVYHIAAGKHTFLDPVFDRIDGAIYRIGGINQKQGMNWKQYAVALLATNGVMMLIGYAILRLQAAPDLQSYGSEPWKERFHSIRSSVS